MTDALLPCPFCGCINVYPVSPSLGHSSWRVFCDDCHAEGPQIPSYNSDEGEARCQWVWQIRQLTQSNAEIIAENKRLREALANLANTINIVGSPYHKAQEALDQIVTETKRAARTALQEQGK